MTPAIRFYKKAENDYGGYLFPYTFGLQNFGLDYSGHHLAFQHIDARNLGNIYKSTIREIIDKDNGITYFLSMQKSIMKITRKAFNTRFDEDIVIQPVVLEALKDFYFLINDWAHLPDEKFR